MAQLGHMDAARRDDRCLFRLSGEFDLSNAWKIQDALLAAIRNEHTDIVVDLSDVRFMDAQLVRALMKARSAAVRRGVAFTIVPPRDAVVGRVAELMDFEEAA